MTIHKPCTFFSAEIMTATFMPYRHLFNSEAGSRLNDLLTTGSTNIYFITRTKKLRFHKELNAIDPLGTVKLMILVGDGNRIVRVQAPIFDIFPSLKLLSSSDPLQAQRFKAFWIDPTLTTECTLTAFARTEAGQDIPLPLPIERLFELDVSFGTDPEVIYIGQSRHLIRRLRSHKKLLYASTLLRDDEELRLHLISFKIGYGGKGVVPFGPEWNDLLARHVDDAAEYRDKILLLERALIAVFQPLLNEQHVGGTLAEDALAKKVLVKRGVGAIALGLGMEGPNWKYWSPRQQCHAELVSYRFDRPLDGFQPGIEPVVEMVMS